jgi:hypothetical protein
MTLTVPVMAPAMQPLVTDDTGTLGSGSRQLELQLSHTRERVHGTSPELEQIGSELDLTLGLGISQRADLMISVPMQWALLRSGGRQVSSVAGVGDVNVWMKWRFLEGERWSLAFEPGVQLPTGDWQRGLGAGAITLGALLAGSLDLDAFGLHLNGGYSWASFAHPEDRAANRADVWQGSAAATFRLVDGLLLAADVGVETSSDRTSNALDSSLLAGVIQRLGDSVDLDAGVLVGLGGSATGVTGLVGLTTRF